MMFIEFANPHNFTPGDFSNRRISWIANATRHARKHGTCGIIRANDDFTLFWRVGGNIRRRTWKAKAVKFI